ncbi:nucleoside-diphosphate kinase [Paenalkalicoccus suaedae]|uniref:Nucleoside diphosphate kinase n=1 Tax=Paenalkalicoccus suaedae TaxID=2592382 RepID=A0A859FCM1_9BACI|nr:nucleoside-diphosphate kinase [Paenalkalicoccus suaedae]QKS71093.1 nucleoside-diphosphate kinase [Paenalkalicoccus suaedae]
MQRTFIMVKPDGVERQLIAPVLAKFQQKGFTLVGAKLMQLSKEHAEAHYAEHKERPFFPDLIEFITSGPVFAMAWEGDGVIDEARKLIGKTDPKEAAPGTIRGDFAIEKSKNIVHGSDSIESAERELALFFEQSELVGANKQTSVLSK